MKVQVNRFPGGTGGTGGTRPVLPREKTPASLCHLPETVVAHGGTTGAPPAACPCDGGLCHLVPPARNPGGTAGIEARQRENSPVCHLCHLFHRQNRQTEMQAGHQTKKGNP